MNPQDLTNLSGDFAHWSFHTQSTTGPLVVTTTAHGGDRNDSAHYMAPRTITVTVQKAQDNTDTTGPQLSISSPSPDSSIPGPYNGVSVVVRGTAIDGDSGTVGSGVARVFVQIGSHNEPKPAIPRASTDVVEPHPGTEDDDSVVIPRADCSAWSASDILTKRLFQLLPLVQ